VVGKILKGVNRRYGALFKGEEELSSRFGSLVFTGVEDDPETLATLKRMGFSSPERVAATIRSWHHGHIAATRTERGRELFTRLAPRLLDAANATGAPDDRLQPLRRLLRVAEQRACRSSRCSWPSRDCSS
jgi:glutamate-ammonia-ligase adenylyltransferase